MRLYYMQTMNPRKACATAKHLGVALDYTKLEPGPAGTRSAAYTKINPNGTAPALVDGDRVLWESAAICAHLARTAGSDLWPTDAATESEVLRWISWDAFHWSRAIGPLYFEHFVKPAFGFGAPDPAVAEKQAPIVERFASILDAHLAGRSFVAGGRLTVADFCLAAMLPGWESLHVRLEPHANVRRWHEGLMGIDAWRDPWPATFDRHLPDA